MTEYNSHISSEKGLPTGRQAPKRVYLAAFIVVFFTTISAADSIGFVPCQIDGTCSAGTESLALSSLPELGTEQATSYELPASSILPERMKISAVDIDLPVQNPSTRDIAALDELLKNGPARYVDSAKLGEKGNVLIFAHSSHLPVVRNQMYKAFNRIPELQTGDSIVIEGDGKSYLYSVTSIRTANAEEAIIDLSPTLGKKLTLVTCDTLTGKSSRYILEADFVGTL
ncbi:hypothetical protein COU18_03805 [Candidatus Kaiserbacteria bacterium CG10_big_fil_rev_8_21_14_0_10_51_14]|uniref:Sortase n=1 Tax=Candidatus Kaiserbacteria bacterium CG10_big_fil_rev_8_21_14_0_10_51_14 TaxID=1974610 RepID=A0A2H0UBI1_9BACT|nr:MAG: hypothetical protein COU18_03805 [Candidatus Kaiserbacteria bacterium CG10_big_fil_rev_8_21_14_0_10_51_14]